MFFVCQAYVPPELGGHGLSFACLFRWRGPFIAAGERRKQVWEFLSLCARNPVEHCAACYKLRWVDRFLHFHRVLETFRIPTSTTASDLPDLCRDVFHPWLWLLGSSLALTARPEVRE